MTARNTAPADSDALSLDRQRMPHGDSARERAMRAATTAIAEHGVNKVRMSDIAAQAGMSTGHILYHFGRKDRLLREVLEWSEADLAERFQQETRLMRSPMRKLATFIEVYLPHHEGDERWALWIQAYAQRLEDSESRTVLASLTTEWEGRLSDIVTEGQRLNAFIQIDVEEFVVRSRTMLDGLALDVMSGAPRWRNHSAHSFALAAMTRELVARE